MKEELIKSYINNLTKDDIKEYLKKELVEASNSEIDTLYQIIKTTDIHDINISFITKYENVFNKNLYHKIIEKYNKYKTFII